MEFNLTNLQLIDERSTNIVLGFIHNAQKLFSTHKNVYYNIPSLVSFIVAFYYARVEYFTKHGKYLELNDERNILSCIKNPLGLGNTAYGNIEIKNTLMKYMWTFKLIHINEKYTFIAIGIDSSDRVYGGKYWFDCKNKNPFYAIQIGGCCIQKHSHCSKPISDWTDNVLIKKGSKIQMEFNVKTKTLQYYINGKQFKFENIHFNHNTKYFMAVCVNNERRSVQLVDFERIPLK
eukprot:127449_1